ncbi:MAG: hypothetical protein QM784_37245 [Polyangiaceae bacterium]
MWNVLSNPNSPSALLLKKDTRERDELIAGAHIKVQFEKTGMDLEEGVKPLLKSETAGTPGTLGFIGETTDTHKLVAVTCHHVVVTIGSAFTTKSEKGREVSGVELTGNYEVRERDGEFVLQVQSSNGGPFVDAPTKRSWRQSNGTRSDDFIVGHPTPGDCCELGRDSFGRVYRSTYTPQVDAAAILLDDSKTDCWIWPLVFPGSDDVTDWRGEMVGKDGSTVVGSAIELNGSVSDIALDELQESYTDPSGQLGHRLRYIVRKYGYKTGYTFGLVRCIEYTQNQRYPFPISVPELFPEEQIPGMGTSDAPARESRKAIAIDQPVPDDCLYIIPCNETGSDVAALFAASGDSGSCVVNAAGYVVGLVINGVQFDDGRPLDGANGVLKFDNITDGWGATATKISHTLEALRVQIKPFIGSQRVRTVPVGNEDFTKALLRSGLSKSAIEIIQGPLSSAARRLLPEVRRLVNGNRRVMVAWHRHNGPRLARHLIRAFQDPHFRVPRDLNGRQSTELMASFFSSLRLECDETSCQALDQLEPWLLRTPGATLAELAAMLEEVPWQSSH